MQRDELLPEHRIKLSDDTRSWVDAFGTHFAECDCGVMLVGRDGSDIARAFVEHERDNR